MTINSDLSRARYVGNGVTNTFAIPFAYLTNNDGTAQIAVYLGDSDTPLIEGKDYTVKGFGKYSDANDQIDEDLITYETRYENGEFTLNNAPMIGEAVAVVRNVPQTQGVVFVEGEKFPAKDFENALDKLTMQVQEIKENMERSIILPPTSTEKPIEVRDNIIQTAKEAQQTSDEAVILIKEAVQEINTVVEENIENSRIWAEGEQAEVKELGGELSSKGWALQASNSATSASQSATQAKTSETNAKSYADSLHPETFVKTTGNQTIEGIKTFTSDTHMQSGDDMSYIVISVNADNTQQTQEVATMGNYRVVDKNGKIIGDVRFRRDTNGTVTSSMVARNYTSNASGVNSVISCSVDKSGNISTAAPTPAVADNSTKIATTNYVNQKIQLVSALPSSPNANVFYFIPG